MPLGIAIWCGSAFLIGLLWFFRSLTLSRVLRKRCILTPESPSQLSLSPASLSFVLAAKDEEDNIDACVRSLLDQDYPGMEIVVVDDRSSDRTPTILRSLAQEFSGRLQVIRIKELPEGWQGKSNAMYHGVRASRGEWLCFTDADCTQTSRKTVSIAMCEIARRQVDFLSITPMLDAPTVWERIIQPVCALVMALWFQPKRVNNPKRAIAYANGAFMLMSRRCYDGIGGHEASRKQLNEDIFMAREAKQRGFRLRVVENVGLYRTRMYSTLKAAWRGWSRIFYGCLAPIHRLIPAFLFLTIFSLFPWVSLVAAWSGVLTSAAPVQSPWLWAAGFWSVAVFWQWLVLVRFYPVIGENRWWSLTYSIGACAAFGMMISAMLKSLGATTTTWRGTVYRRHESQAEVPTATSETVCPSPIESSVQHVS